jgi:hydrogenase maturation protease
LIPAADQVLLFGYGNPGREDDGLGTSLAEVVEKLAIAGVAVDANYQLSVEDAATVAKYPAVIFADAAVAGPEPFSFAPLAPKRQMSFSTHSVDAATVLGLAEEMFEAKTKGYLLGIRGYSFAMFTEKMTAQAEANLAAAIEFLTPLLRQGPKALAEAGNRSRPAS